MCVLPGGFTFNVPVACVPSSSSCAPESTRMYSQPSCVCCGTIAPGAYRSSAAAGACAGSPCRRHICTPSRNGCQRSSAGKSAAVSSPGNESACGPGENEFNRSPQAKPPKCKWHRTRHFASSPSSRPLRGFLGRWLHSNHLTTGTHSRDRLRLASWCARTRPW